VAALALFAGGSLTPFGDLIALTVETADGTASHSKLPSQKRERLAYLAVEIHIYNITQNS